MQTVNIQSKGEGMEQIKAKGMFMEKCILTWAKSKIFSENENYKGQEANVTKLKMK